jgi:transposase
VLVAKGYRPVDRDQVFLLPPNLRDWLPPGHRVWFILDVVDTLDLSALHKLSKLGGVGRAGYDPQVLLGVMFYAYMHGLLSSRGIEKACGEDVAYMVACGRDVPDHTVIARFRQRHEAVIKDLFAQVLELCVRAGLGRLDVVAIDGTKIAANAGKSRNRKRSKLEAQAAEVLARAAAADAAEDARFGKGNTGLDVDPLWQDEDTRKDLITDSLAKMTDDDTGDADIDDTDGDGGGGTGCGASDPLPAPTSDEPVSTEPASQPPASTEPEPPAATDLAVPAPIASTEVAVPVSTDLAVPAPIASTEVAVPVSTEVAVSARVLARRARFQRDADARFLAALASIQAQDAVRDEVFRQPRLVRANGWLERARAKVDRVRAEQQEKEAERRRVYDIVAAAARQSRPWRDHPVEDCSALRRAKEGLAKAEQNLADVLASPRPPSLRTDRVGNLTDPDSRMMASTGGYLQGYNAQIACSNDHLILAVDITQSGNDHSSGITMMNAAVEAVKRLATALNNPDLQIGTIVMDAGYCSTDTITAPGPDRLIATARDLKQAAGPTVRSPDDLNELGKMAKRLVEPGNAALYKRRGATIEPVNGHVKDRRGLRRFSRRGLPAVLSELTLAATATNLAKLHVHLNPGQPVTTEPAT